jgi:hypothetical protein
MAMTLDQAIQNHISNQKRRQGSFNSKMFARYLQTDIHIFERTRRDSKSIKLAISTKKRVKARIDDCAKVLEIDDEIESLERLLDIVSLHEEGKPLEGVGY